MLSQGQIRFFLLLMVAFIGCEINQKGTNFNNDDMRDYTKENFYKYEHIYHLAIDSIKSHSLKRFNDFTFATYKDYWELDSCFIFNKDSTRLMGIFYHSSSNIKTARSDEFFMFTGFKIDGAWRFGSGRDAWVAPHDFYGDSLYAPLPMHKIKYMAHKSGISAYLRKTEEGTFVPNYKLLDEYFFDRRNFKLPDDFPNEKFDSINMYYFNTLIYSSYVTDKELHELDSIFENSVQPSEPLKDSKGRNIYDSNGKKIKRSRWSNWF